MSTFWLWAMGTVVWALCIWVVIGFFQVATASDPKEPGEPD